MSGELFSSDGNNYIVEKQQIIDHLKDVKIDLTKNQPSNKNKIITFQITPKTSFKVHNDFDENGSEKDVGYFTTVYHLFMDNFEFGKEYNLHDHNFFDLIYYLKPEENFINEAQLQETSSSDTDSKQYLNKFSGPISILGRNNQENDLMCEAELDENLNVLKSKYRYSDLAYWYNINKDYPRLSTVLIRAGCIYYVKYLGLKQQQ